MPIVATRFDESGGRVSPDGVWVAYVSNETGRQELYVRRIDGSGAKYTVTSEGGFFPGWTKGGRELVYASPAGLMVVSFAASPSPAVGKPELLSAIAKLEGAFDLAAVPDGGRFVVLFRKPAAPLTEIRVVLNWAQSLASHWR